jgi:hypothetical protein
LQALRPLGDAKRAEQEKALPEVALGPLWRAAAEHGRRNQGDARHLSQEQALELWLRLWREPVWDLKIVAGRILARKSIAPDAKVWGFVTERLIDLDGWAVADNS